MSAGKRQGGFTYVGFLIFIAIAAAGLAAYGEVASHATQRGLNGVTYKEW